VEVSVQAGGAGKGMTDLLNEMVDIAMVSREISKEEEGKGAIKIAVCKDATLPIISSKNPYLNTLLKKGIKKSQLLGIFTSKIGFWNEVYDLKENKKINVYTRSDACGAGETFANYLGLHQEDLEGIGIYGDPQIVDSVGRDPLGIGYANIAFIYDKKTSKPHESIKILPLDLNEDGNISKEEDFYLEKGDILLAIKDGKLPSPPSRNLYLVVKKGKVKPYVVDFLKWILGDGQKIVEKAGFVRIEIKDKNLNF
ncbi:MAG: substrate-binding domain-containing protein, partial [Thermoanaerobaculia bacterium]